MALVLKDRVQQTGTANTTVSFTLSGSVTGLQSFAIIGDGNTTYYSAYDTTGNWEVGLGTYASAGPTLTRTTIYSSSNGGSAATFSGVVNVFVTQPAENTVVSSNNLTATSGQVLTFNGVGVAPSYQTVGGGGGSGTVTAISLANTNGFYNTITNPTTTPSITINPYGPTGNNSCFALGYQAFSSDTAGNDSTAIGSQALLSSTSGVRNDAFGARALYYNSSGYDNVAFGREALYSNGSGNSNTALGGRSLHQNSNGNNNTAIGLSAMYANTSGSDNTAVGYNCLRFNTTGSGNLAVGSGALGSNTTGSNNLALGQDALGVNTTGTRLVAIAGGLAFNSTGNDNIGIGPGSIYTNSTGESNVGIGTGAGFKSTGSYGVYIGAQAGNNVQGSWYNTNVGFGSGRDVTSGGGHTLVGNYTGNQGGLDIRTANNWAVISDGNGNPKMMSDNNSNFIVPVTSSGPTLPFNSTMSFQLVSDTLLKILVKGSDGVTRSASLVLT